jgi:hypothetical protein
MSVIRLVWPMTLETAIELNRRKQREQREQRLRHSSWIDVTCGLTNVSSVVSSLYNFLLRSLCYLLLKSIAI